MKIYKLSIFLIFFSFFQLTVNAINVDADAVVLQQRTVTGTVVDEAGVTLPGVNVFVKGTGTGVVTDVNGRYSIAVPSDAVLVFSFVGFNTVEQVVGDLTVINITMSESAQELDEVIVVGYGTMRKSDLTGAVTRVNMEEKEMLANVTLSQALSGAAPGISIVGTSGRAGADPSINIRGQNSFSGSQSPLVVLDGAIFYGSLADLNANDVESIDILKDASAAAVYGSRSANGVILITTKKGKEGKPRVSFNTFYGWQWITNTNRRMMNGMEYAQRLIDFDWEDDLYTWYKKGPTNENDLGGRPVRPDINDINVLAGSRHLRGEEASNILAGNETDWMKVMTNEAAPIQNYNLSFSGRTDRLNYFVSASYMDETGIQKFDFTRRYNLRMNLDSKITDWLTLGVNASYMNRNDASDRYANMDTYLRSVSPWADNDTDLPVEQRKMFYIGESYMHNPLEREAWWMHSEANSFFFITNAKVTIPWVEGLSYEFKWSKRTFSSENDRFIPAFVSDGAANNGQAEKRPTYGGNWLVDNIISYLRTFGDHSVNATLLYERDYQNRSEYRVQSFGFENPVMGYNNLQMGVNITTSDPNVWMESNIGYMARLNYTYKNRYMVTGTVRRDGASSFPAGNKWATLPSVSLAWVLSDEAFMSNLSWLYTKVRLSYGVTGNPTAGRYSSLSRVGTYKYEWGSDMVVAAWPDAGGMGNMNLLWEKKTGTNLGIDFGLWKRVNGNIELYSEKTTDVLVNRTMPWMSGFTTIKSNLGKLQNRGVEIAVNTVNLQNTAIKWRTGASFSLNRNKILDIYGDDTKGDANNGWFVGKSMGAIFALERTGIWQEEDLFEGRIGPNSSQFKDWYPGHWKFTDGGFDAQTLEPIAPDGTLNEAGDRKIIGYREANFRWTLSNTFNYKQWGLFVMFNSVMGGGKNNWLLHGCYNAVNVQERSDDVRRMNQQGNRPYWTPFNRVNNTSGVFNAQPYAGEIYESRQFVRLQDVTLSYNFNRNQLSKMGGVIEQLQLFVTGRNLYTWTKWPDWDPEVQWRQYSNNSNQNANNFNIRNVTVGLRLTF